MHHTASHHLHVSDVGDIVGGVSVQSLLESVLVEEVTDETDAASEHEQTVERSHLDVLLCLLERESSARSQQVDEAYADASVDIEDEVGLLLGGELLHAQSEVEHLGRREVLLGELLDDHNANVGVLKRLDLVT